MNLQDYLPKQIQFWLQNLPWRNLRPRDAMPFEIGNRRIYVLPTRFGFFIGFTLLVLTLGALNYNNNGALILSFIIISACNNSLIGAHLTLLGLNIQTQSISSVFAGQLCELKFSIHTKKSKTSQTTFLTAKIDEFQSEFELDQQQSLLSIKIPSLQRGILHINKLEIFTLQPLGLAKAWSTISLRQQVIIYPTPRGQALHTIYTDSQGAGGAQSKQITDQPHHIREFNVGDSRKQIAWKASARTGQLQVREYESAQAEQLVFDWRALQSLAYEQKIEQLCLWVIQAEQRNLSYSLILPNKQFTHNLGAAHKVACLEALALMPYE